MEGDTTLTLNQNAELEFNTVAEGLLEEITPEPPNPSPLPNKYPDAHVAHEFNSNDIRWDSMVKGHADVAGRLTGKFFFEKDKGFLGLENDPYKTLVQLSEEIKQRPEIRDYLSREFLENKLFEWIKNTYKGKTTVSATEFVLKEGNAAVEELEVWLPIPALYTTVNFRVGNIEFRSISKDCINLWQENATNDVKTETEDITESFLKLRKRCQGLAAATIKLSAEPIRAQEIALEETEKSTAALRIFSPEILHPLGRSYWEPMSFVDPMSSQTLFVKNDKLSSSQEWMSPVGLGHNPITKESISTLFTAGLSTLDSLIRNKKPTKFQKDCLNALYQYSKAALKRDPSEKLLYVISALEAIFLSDASIGGIVKTLEERLAVFVRENLTERVELSKKIRTVYKIRSKFVHSSLPVTDLETVESFLIDAMAAFRNLLLVSSIYETKEFFIRNLDLHRTAGPRYHPLQFQNG